MDRVRDRVYRDRVRAGDEHVIPFEKHPPPPPRKKTKKQKQLAKNKIRVR